MPVTDWLFLTLLLLMLLVLPLVALLVVVVTRQSKSQTNLLTNLMLAEKDQTQSLLNQLRSGDPMTLHALQSATGQAPSISEQGYSPSYDEGIQYGADLGSASGYKIQDVDDELYASGWDGVLTRDSGGTPVTFERPESE